MRLTILTLLIFVMMTCLCGCTTYDNFKEAFFGSQNTDTIKIAIYEPLKGEYSDEGELEVIGFEIANEIAPTVLDKEIEFIYVDTASDLEVAKTAIENLIPKVPCAVLGSYGSTYSILGSEYFENAQIPAIAITNENPYVTKDNDYYFRIATVETRQADAIAEFAYEALNLDALAIMNYDGDDVASSINTSLETWLEEEYNGEIAVTTYDILSTDQSYEVYFSRIKKEGITTIFLPTDEVVAVNIINDAVRLGYKFDFIGTENINTEEFIESIGDQSINIYFPTMEATIDENAELYDEFVKLYEEKYPGNEIAIETAMAFDGYMLLLDSIERAGQYENGKDLKEYILNTDGFSGITGTYTFDENGDPISDIKIMQYTDGKLSTVYVSIGIGEVVEEPEGDEDGENSEDSEAVE